MDKAFEAWWGARRLDWHTQYDTKFDVAREAFLAGYKAAKEESIPKPTFCRCGDKANIEWDGFGGGKCRRCNGDTF